MGRRRALIIASDEFTDAGLRRLVAPRQDADDLSRVLADPTIGAFAVTMVINETRDHVERTIARFMSDVVERDDAILVYFSGHGVKDESGQLYFAMADTELDLLSASAVSSSFLSSQLSRARADTKLVLIDCCYSGAFSRAFTSKDDRRVNAADELGGSGRVIIAASSALQYSFEGTSPSGSAVQSVFTKHLVRGLATGAADLDGDGRITVDELYRYVHAEVVSENPSQRPNMSADTQGIVLFAHSPLGARPAQIPDDLIAALESSLTSLRLAAVEELGTLLRSRNRRIVAAARDALSARLDDDSRTISSRAAALMSSFLPSDSDAPTPTSIETGPDADASKPTSIETSPDVDAAKHTAIEPGPDAPLTGIEAREAEAKSIRKEDESAVGISENSASDSPAEQSAPPTVSHFVESAWEHSSSVTTKSPSEPVESQTDSTEDVSLKADVPRINRRVAIGVIGVLAAGGIATAIAALGGDDPSPTSSSTAGRSTTVASASGTSNLPQSTATDLIGAARAEGAINLVGIPLDWVNYKESVDGFRTKFGLEVESANPSASSVEEIQAVQSLHGQSTQPDSIDVTPKYALQAAQDGLLAGFMPSTWDEIPTSLKDPNGLWIGSYYGLMAIGSSTSRVPNAPVTWADLLKPDYHGLVQLSQDPRTSGTGLSAVFAAALASGGSFDNVQPGIDYYAKLKSSGNLLPTAGSVSFATAVVIDWTYNLVPAATALKAPGTPFALHVPSDGIFASFYAQAAIKGSPHPNAAKLWIEWLVGDEGALSFLKAGALPARYSALLTDGQVPQSLTVGLPSAEALEQITFPSASQIDSALTLVKAQWAAIVGGS